MLQTLIGSDRRVLEDFALARIGNGALERITSEPAADRADQDPLGIEALEQDTKSLVDLADDVFRPEIDLVEEYLPLGLRRGDADRNVLLLDALRLQV